MTNGEVLTCNINYRLFDAFSSPEYSLSGRYTVCILLKNEIVIFLDLTDGYYSEIILFVAISKNLLFW
jgi:hypothetical protein